MSQKPNIINELDLLISQEKNSLLSNLREGDRLEDKLAQFMAGLQLQIDTLIESKKAEQLAAASEVGSKHTEAHHEQAAKISDEAEKAMQLLEKEFNTYNIKQANGIMNQKRSMSYIVKQSLIGTAVAAGLLWFFFPQADQALFAIVAETPAETRQSDVESKSVAEAALQSEPVAVVDVEAASDTELKLVDPVVDIAQEVQVAKQNMAEEIKPEPVKEVKAPVLNENKPVTKAKVESLLDETPEIKVTSKAKEPEVVVGQEITVTAHVGNARNTPSNKGKRVARVKMGDKVIKLNEQMGWYQVKLESGTVAWMYKTIFAPRLQVSVGIGNVRKSPNGKAKVISRIKQGDFVTKLEEQGGWYLVKLDNGTKAWGHHSIF
ncbi:bacterial SH3 domain protein [Mariprofundus micogutta]|uniref:Bacterial SH3 domain protein n=1 Tax=Mariprofundus micogutta TaxID=1921010 RepID=A0A1L8CQB0_9PROT|nr:SH3 domain-containing protein [Mariprofundus micogutta]GAV21098.1 bacterial SH3 domain protein [Mariprofundus micogutta]